MTSRFFALPGLLVAITLAGCVEKPPQAIAPPRPAPVMQGGLDRVIGQNAQALLRLFGEPDFDAREGTARKLQFASGICVLDAYLYPPVAGREPVVRHIDARLPNGDDFDRASCIAALSRRGEAR
jgi:hypothetical protein